MRDIMFRGKRKDNGEWVYGGYWKDHCYGNKQGEKHYIPQWNSMGLSYWEHVEVDPETIGQFTGRYSLYEGDIIKAIYFNEEEPFTAVIEWDKVALCWGLKCLEPLGKVRDHRKDGPLSHAESAERLGNIHDNPELAEVKKQC